VHDLLVEMGLQGKPVVVEHNKVALFPRQHATTSLKDDDVLEIVEIAAGG
jgi:thiamine biosynthesis protein ThiS